MSRQPPGKFDASYRSRAWMNVYGSNTAAATTSVVFQMDTLGITATTWNPPIPAACRLVGGAIMSVCGFNTVAGDWTLNFKKNESGTVLASADFPCDQTIRGTVLDWDDQIILQPGDRWFVDASGPEKNTVILRVCLDLEIL